MRSLIHLFLFVGGLAEAAPGNVQISFSTGRSAIERAGQIGSDETTSSHQNELRLGATSPELQGRLTFGVFLSHLGSRNGSFLVAPPDQGGTEIPLSDLEPASKTRVGLQAGQSIGSTIWTLEHSQDTSFSLIAERRWRLTLSRSFIEGTSILGYEGQRASIDQPASRFVHPLSFRTLDRPDRLQEERHSIYWEQALLETWKARLLLHEGRLSQVRPRFRGFELRQVFAVGRWYPQLGLGRLAEAAGDPLEDDRGDAASQWVDFGAAYQLDARWLLRGSATSALEEESKRPGFGNAEAALTGLRAGLEYTKGTFKIIASLGTVSGDRGYSEQTFQGGLQWDLPSSRH